MNSISSKKSKKNLVIKQNETWQIYFQYTLAFLLISLMAFFQFIFFKKTLIWEADGFLQWYPMLVKLKTIVINFFQGNGFALWSWDTGLGADWIGNYSLIFCDPFNYLAILFSNEKMDIAYSLIVILKMYCAGVTMLCFLRHHQKESMLCLIGATGYAFCAWGFALIRQGPFMLELIIFPLLILGVDKIEKKESPKVLICGVFFSLIFSLYFSYMNAIYVFIYILVRFFWANDNKSAKMLFIKLLKYMLYAILGALLAAPILVPILFALMGTSTDSGIDLQLLPSIRKILRFLPSLIGFYDTNENNSVIGMNMLFVSMIPAIFYLIKKKKVSAWMFFLSLVFAFFPILQSVMNGFSYPSGRWCYIMAFFFSYAAVESLELKWIYTKDFRNKMLIWLSIIFGIAIISRFMFKVLTTADIMIITSNSFLALVAYFVLVNGDREISKRRKDLSTIIGIAIILTANIRFSPYGGNVLGIFMSQGSCHSIYESSSLKVANQINDMDFFRVDSVEHPANSGGNITYTHNSACTNIYWNIPTIFEYTSTIDSNWLEFNRLLGNSSGYNRRVSTYSNDNRSRMDYLLGVKYFLGDNAEKGYSLSQYAGYGYMKQADSDGISILKSKYNTSLGYVYQNMISESDWKKYNALEREQVLMQCAQTQDEDLKQLQTVQTADKSQIQTDTRKLSFQLTGSEKAVCQDNEITVTQANAPVKVILSETVRNSEVYLFFHNLKKEEFSTDELWDLSVENTGKSDTYSKTNFYLDYLSHVPYGNFDIRVSADGITKRLLNAEGEPQAIRDIEDYMVNIGYKEEFSGEITCSFSNMGRYTYDSIEVIAVPQTDFDTQAAKLEENRLHVNEWSSNHIEGEIDTEEGGLLYLSILYNKGWKIFVDGEKIDNDKIYRVNTAFTGIEVPAGKHSIVLHYRPVGHPFTMLLFLVGVFGTITIELINRKKLLQN